MSRESVYGYWALSCRHHVTGVVLAMAIFSCAAAADRYSGGTGTPDAPYLIATPEDLNSVDLHREDWDSHFLLVNDINLADFAGTEFNMIGDYFGYDDPQNRFFTGVFDGGGHMIANFSWSGEECEGVGLFECLGPGGSIHNLVVTGANIQATDCHDIGILVGSVDGGDVFGCQIEAILTGSSSGPIGSVCGSLNGGRVSHCTAVMAVIADASAGLLIGTNENGIVSNSQSSGSICVEYNGGGLVANNLGGTISDCRSDADFQGEVGQEIGGLVAWNAGVIVRSSSRGRIFGSMVVGGLVADNRDGIVRSCRSDAVVSATDGLCGGLVGINSGLVYKCSSQGSVDGLAQVGGLVGANESGSISLSFAVGRISGGGPLGGIIGEDFCGLIHDCYARGDVNGVGLLGGVVGYAIGSDVRNCYSTARIDGRRDIGGLIGLGEDIEDTTVTESFWDMDVSGIMESSGGEGRDTATMMDRRAYVVAGWDFIAESDNGTEDIWTIHDGQDYPRLVWDTADCAGGVGVTFTDYSLLAANWGRSACESSPPCGDSDIDFSGTIDWIDLAAMAAHWLGR